jgi:hypothetical protein
LFHFKIKYREIFRYFILKWNSTCFGLFLCPSSGVFHCTYSNGMSYRFADSWRAGSGWNAVPSWSCSQAVNKPVWYIPLLYVQWKTPDDEQRNCPKHVEFHFKIIYREISGSSWFYCKKFCSILTHCIYTLLGIHTTNSFTWLALVMTTQCVDGATATNVLCLVYII